MRPTALMHRLAAQDRALYLRWVMGESASRAELAFWKTITHAGGISASVTFALIPLVLAEAHLRIAAVQAAWALALSTLVVQVIKRNVVRARPTGDLRAHIKLPDRFSFPSGHATGVMSVAFIHAANFPSLGWPLLMLAGLVGFSRIRLGVHYPSDVVVGQLIAIATGVMVRALW